MSLEAGRAELEAVGTDSRYPLPRVRWLFALAALAALVGVLLVPSPPPVAAAPTVIDFDDLAHDTGVDAQYPGVRFNFTATVQQGTTSFAHSGTKYARACVGEEISCEQPIRAVFDEGKYRVRVYVGYGEPLSTNRRVQLRVYSRGTALSAPALLGSMRYVFPASSSPAPIRQELFVELSSNSIWSAEVDVPGGDDFGVVVDDFEFERGDAKLTFTPNPVDFGDALVNGGTATRTVTVTNTGEVTTTPREAYVDGTDAADFTIMGETCTGRLLPPGGQCSADVGFDPVATGGRTAALVVTRTGADPPESVPLLGTGTTTTTTTGEGSTTTATIVPTTTSGSTGTTLRATTTTIVIPPTTPGATLEVGPTIGTPGFVASARGTGFAPGSVELTWVPGLGITQAEVGPDGTFVVQVLIMPNDRLGRRTLVATGAVTTATADFLVVQRSVKPSGTDVTHINRSRRYNNR